MSHSPMAPLPGHRWTALAAGAVLTLALAACSSAASPTPGSSVAAGSTGASASAVPTATTVPSASQATSARCAATPAASANATVHIAGFSFGDAVTITAGQAVAFTNQDGVAHTVTEGTGGVAASGACVDQLVAGGSSLVVTFNQAGDYQITCKIHHTMQTVVHVQ